jgi:hypothetical protein
MLESRRELALAGVALTLLGGLGSFLVYLVAQQQCLGGAGQSLEYALAERNKVCRALGLPVAPGAGSHLLLVGILLVPPVVATLGTVAALDSGSSRPLAVACVLCAVAGLGLIILVGNASVGAPGI